MYEKMYCILFNAITDRLRENQNMNFGRAAFLLEEAQRQAEAVYLESAEEKTASSSAACQLPSLSQGLPVRSPKTATSPPYSTDAIKRLSPLKCAPTATNLYLSESLWALPQAFSGRTAT